MKKILSYIHYKIQKQATWSLLYLVINVAVTGLLYCILINSHVLNSETGSLGYRIWGIILFHFVVTMRFREDFDFFLINNNTREEIFSIMLITAIIFNVIYSVLIVGEKLVIDRLNLVLGFTNSWDIFHYFAPYYMNGIAGQFLYFFSLCSCASIFGLLLGSLFYRFGRKFTLVFWLIFAAVPLVLLPLALGLDYRQSFSGIFQEWEHSLKTFNVPGASGWMLFLAVVFTLGAYLNIRRLPQR